MTKRGPYRKGEAKRAEILQAALEMFAVEGYRGTSLRKVAAQCGLSMPGIMHYFDSREDLLTQVLLKRDEAARARQGTPVTLQDVLDVIDEGQRTPGLVELFVSLAAAASDTGHPAHEFFAARYREFRSTLAERLATAQEEGRIRATLPPERLAILMLAVVDGIQLQWMVNRSIEMSQAVVDLFQLLDWAPPPTDAPETA